MQGINMKTIVGTVAVAAVAVTQGESAAVGSTIQCGTLGSTATSMVCRVTLHDMDTFKAGVSDSAVGVAPGCVGDAEFCMDKVPAEDAEHVECASGCKTAAELFPHGTIASGKTLIAATGGLEVALSGTNALTSTVSAFARFDVDAGGKAQMYDITVLGKDNQSSAFSAAYAASVFAASSVAVAALALF